MKPNREHRHIVEQHLGTRDIRSQAAHDMVDGIPVAERTADVVFMEDRYEEHAARIEAGDRVSARLLRSASEQIRTLTRDRDLTQKDLAGTMGDVLEAHQTVRHLLRNLDRQSTLIAHLRHGMIDDEQLSKCLREITIPRNQFTQDHLEEIRRTQK